MENTPQTSHLRSIKAHLLVHKLHLQNAAQLLESRFGVVNIIDLELVMKVTLLTANYVFMSVHMWWWKISICNSFIESVLLPLVQFSIDWQLDYLGAVFHVNFIAAA
jgi:hypothetical protein